MRRGAHRALIVADMPFMSYQVHPDEAFRNAGRLMKEAGAAAVKLEGGQRVLDAVARMTAAGIPVMGHLGLTPQSIYQFGSYQARGRDPDEAEQIYRDALGLEEAGAFAIVLEKFLQRLPSELPPHSASQRSELAPDLGVMDKFLSMPTCLDSRRISILALSGDTQICVSKSSRLSNTTAMMSDVVIFPMKAKVISLLVVLLLGACEQGTVYRRPEDVVFPDSNVSYVRHVEPLLRLACAFTGCHSSSDRIPLDSYLALFQTPGLVIAGHPERSRLNQVLEGQLAHPPVFQDRITDNHRRGMATWVREGARNN